MNFSLAFARTARACAFTLATGFAAGAGLGALTSAISPAWAQADTLAVENAWARATPPGAPVGGAYFTVRNEGAAADRLVGGESPASARVELHTIAAVDRGDPGGCTSKAPLASCAAWASCSASSVASSSCSASPSGAASSSASGPTMQAMAANDSSAAHGPVRPLDTRP